MLPGERIPGSARVDAVGLARLALPLITKVSPSRAFRAAVDDVAAVGRRRPALAFQKNVSSPASPLRMSFRTAVPFRPPMIVSLPAPPLTVSLPREGIDRVVAGRAVQRVVAAWSPPAAPRRRSPA